MAGAAALRMASVVVPVSSGKWACELGRGALDYLVSRQGALALSPLWVFWCWATRCGCEAADMGCAWCLSGTCLGTSASGCCFGPIWSSMSHTCCLGCIPHCHGLVPIGAGLAVALALGPLHMAHVAGHRRISVCAEVVRDLSAVHFVVGGHPLSDFWGGIHALWSSTGAMGTRRCSSDGLCEWDDSSDASCCPCAAAAR